MIVGYSSDLLQIFKINIYGLTVYCQPHVKGSYVYLKVLIPTIPVFPFNCKNT